MAWLIAMLAFALFGAGIYLAARRHRQIAIRSAQREAELMAMAGIGTPAKTTTEPALRRSPEVSVPRGPRKFLVGMPKATYYLLKLALPDYEIFARIPLADVLGDSVPAGRPTMLDFAVCSRDMEVASVVLLEQDGRETMSGASMDRTELVLRAAGIRCVRLDSRRLPDRKEVREIVLGQA